MAEKELTYEAAFPGRFLKAALFEGKNVTLTISRAYMEELEGDKKKENKLILGFGGTDKELVCNKTNAFCLKEMFGNKVAQWVGKRIAFHPTTCAFGPKQVDCIRIFGSPDIAEDVEISARIGRKTLKTTLRAVKSAAKPVASSNGIDPRIAGAWEILQWSKAEGEQHRQEHASLSDAEYQISLNALIDNMNAA